MNTFSVVYFFQLFCFVAFVCLIATPKCGGTHVFLAAVTWLVILTQTALLVVFLFRLQTKFSGIDFEFLVSRLLELILCIG